MLAHGSLILGETDWIFPKSIVLPGISSARVALTELTLKKDCLWINKRKY